MTDTDPQWYTRRTLHQANLDDQCPNCEYYMLVSETVERAKHKAVDYTGWRWWKDTRTTVVRKECSRVRCIECGWVELEGRR